MKARVVFMLLCVSSVLGVDAQSNNWQHKDWIKDSVFGISTEKSYEELLKNKPSQTIVVAVIDSGIDTAHADLRTVIWTDLITGIHGWNFIGAETGREDVTLLVASKKTFFDSLAFTFVPEQYRREYQAQRKAVSALQDKIAAMQNFILQLQHYDTKEAKELRRLAQFHLEHGLNIDNLEPDTATGNPDVSPDPIGPLPKPNRSPLHGTHVAGIIGAVRNNGKGMDGIADNVQLMPLKLMGNIRELRDRNLAAAIRFAVDHHAKIINISMGKPYTWNKNVVDEAVQYAMQKDVLIVQGAGNDGKKVDSCNYFPTKRYLGKGEATAWLGVGASDQNGDAAAFSNYGKTSVDVFAPGVDIYSTIPCDKYDSWDGTSMAAPVVSGLAALIWGYYPKLTSIQVKEIIMKSVVKRDVLKDKCVSGGVVNAFNAFKLASTYK